MMNLIEIHEVLRRAGIETVEELERRLQLAPRDAKKDQERRDK